MEKITIVADCREDFPSTTNTKHYNDHYSRKSIQDIQMAIQKLGYLCEWMGGVKSLIQSLNGRYENTSTLYLNFSDGLMQKNRRMQAPLLLELMGVAYTGSDPFSVGVVNDKYFANKFLKEHNIRVPSSCLYHNLSNSKKISYPVVVKPNNEGSSLGIFQNSICSNMQEVERQAQILEQQNYIPLIEEYIPGYEITNFIIGNSSKILLNEVILSEYNNNIYFEYFVFGQNEKAHGKRKQRVLTNENTLFSLNLVKEKSIFIFELLGLRDIARLDYRITKSGEPILIEVNSLPVFSMTSEIGTICHYYNKTLCDMLNLLIETAKERLKL